MYESDGSIMVYWHALDTPETPTGKLAYKHYTFSDSNTDMSQLFTWKL